MARRADRRAGRRTARGFFAGADGRRAGMFRPAPAGPGRPGSACARPGKPGLRLGFARSRLFPRRVPPARSAKGLKKRSEIVYNGDKRFT